MTDAVTAVPAVSAVTAATDAMADATHFGGIVGLAALVLVAAVLGNRLSQWLRLPAPVIFLIAAAVASDLFPRLSGLSIVTVQRIVTVALS